MEFSEYRPIISGLLGGLAATILCAAWAKWLPKGRNGKTPETLLLQHRFAVRLASFGAVSGIALALCMYVWGGYPSNDWRPIALGVGLCLSAPIFLLPLAAWLRKRSVAEAFIAFALNQRTPVFLLYPLLALGIPMVAVAVVSL